ncbi:hypothetical protein MUK42_31947 [Musa troglodytarum]|uniref:Uncharacterized protein n=1 Tax=Musa troglodytarum TaxID=320322 RepID=A0A9E7FNM1_9LILI|nr:hypothetical protein MUK42_31947 [Musa troglodytarum]
MGLNHMGKPGIKQELAGGSGSKNPECSATLFFHKLSQPGTRVLARILRSEPVISVRNCG